MKRSQDQHLRYLLVRVVTGPSHFYWNVWRSGGHNVNSMAQLYLSCPSWFAPLFPSCVEIRLTYSAKGCCANQTSLAWEPWEPAASGYSESATFGDIVSLCSLPDHSPHHSLNVRVYTNEMLRGQRKPRWITSSVCICANVNGKTRCGQWWVGNSNFSMWT